MKRKKLVVRFADASEWDAIRDMDKVCFPDDDPIKMEEGDVYWVATMDGKLSGYAGLKPVQEYREGYIHRAGVLPEYRGRGIQRRLTEKQIRWASGVGMRRLVTYTTARSVISANNYLSCGFRLYIPDWMWGNTNYFRMEMKL